MSEVSFADFKKNELRVAKILEVTEIPGADRLWKLRVDVGTETKEIVAGIKAFYSPQELLGKSVIVVNNLAPSVIRGVESRGMLLAASVKGGPGENDGPRLVLITLDREMPAGTPVG